MIILHHPKSDQENELKQRLDRLSLNYKVEEHESDELSAPFIEEDGQNYKEKEEIEAWFLELEEELNVQRTISGDGCYINPRSGKVT